MRFVKGFDMFFSRDAYALRKGVCGMKKPEGKCGKERGAEAAQAGAMVSRLYLMLALVLLVLTLKTCVPAVGAVVSRAAETARQTRTVQAFAALTERLHEGEAVQQALSGSFEILTGAGD